MKKTLYTIIALGFLMVFAVSCSDNNETEPGDIPFTYGTIVTVDQVKALYDDQLAIDDYTLRYPVEITEDWALSGIITASDKKDGNLYKEAYIQDATGGLRMVFESTSGLYIGDSVIVKLEGLFIGDYGDFWQLGAEPYHEDDGDIRVGGMNMDKYIKKTAINEATFPDTLTITAAKKTANLGKLIAFKDVQFADDMNGLTWADAENLVTENRDLVDCDDKTIVVRTSGYASAAGELLPTGKGTIVGILTIFNGTYQFIIRDFDEVNMTGTRCGVVEQPLGGPVETLTQDFQSVTASEAAYLTGWQNIAQTGGRLWTGKKYSTNYYVQATAYNSGLASMITWLITPKINISSQKILTFEAAQAYWAHGTDVPLEVLYSTYYDGTNLTTATWTAITVPTLPGSGDTNYEFVSSGDISLPVVSGGSCVIAFKYTGSKTKSTTICIDNVSVTTSK